MTLGFVLLAVCLGTAVGLAPSAFNSPCPELFHYESTDGTNQWTGNVKLLSDADLHGVWIRLIFDDKLSELNVGDNFGEIVTSTSNEFLIKDRNFILKTSTPKNLKITVKYEGTKVPKLVGFRLNGQMVCSENKGEFYSGDVKNNAFWTSLSSKSNAGYLELETCGTTQLTKTDLKNAKSEPGQWPWQASLYYKNENAETYACEATLISLNHLITPAHCVTYLKSTLAVNPSQLIVYLGKYNPNGENKDVQKLAANKITLYPGFDKTSLLNDVAIIHLEKPIVVSDNVKPICLGRSSEKREGFLVGYGIGQDGKFEDLAQAKVKIVEEKDISKQLSGLVTDNSFTVKFVEDNSLCVGDSGSTFTSLREGAKPVWELRGVVTAGIALQDKYVCSNSSSVLVLDVARYIKWIQAVIA